MKCLGINCGTLLDPTNGTVTVTTSTVGSMAIYTCNEGFTVIGSRTQTCVNDGLWAPAAPICGKF